MSVQQWESLGSQGNPTREGEESLWEVKACGLMTPEHDRGRDAQERSLQLAAAHTGPACIHLWDAFLDTTSLKH